jgi:predicted phosphodiesterase
VVAENFLDGAGLGGIPQLGAGAVGVDILNIDGGQAGLLEAHLHGADGAGPFGVVGGDVVEGPLPVETLELLDAVVMPLVWVRSNCDRDPSEWVRERVGEERVAWLAGLPTTVTIDVDGLGAVCFCHGSPRSDEDIVTAVSAVARVEPMLDGVDEDLVVSGHTHVQFDRVVANRRLVNAGSVGMPYQGESGWAYWTMFGPTVEHRRSAFDADALTTAEMQLIARELQLGDTAFVLHPDGTDHDLRVRFFTPRAEAAAGPRVVYSNEMAAELATAIPGAVAFVEADQVPKGLKVLKVNGKLPGDKDYPLR